MHHATEIDRPPAYRHRCQHGCFDRSLRFLGSRPSLRDDTGTGSPVEARDGASVFELTALLYRVGAELLASAVIRVVAGDKGIAQSGSGTYQSWPTAAETTALRRRGGALLRFMDLVRLTRARLPR
jgi:hypothetical protein